MADLAIISANFAHFDEVRSQPEQDVECDWLMVTEDPELEVPEPWTRVVHSDDGLHPCLAAKRFRTEPWKYWPHERFIWVDANMQVTTPVFAREVLDCIENGFATWRHPRRDCAFDEAEASVGAEAQNGKYADQPIMEQAEHYRSEGHPEHWGLWATGTLAWDATDPKMHEFGRDWLAECMRWTIQDQISFPVVCRRHGIKPGVFALGQIEQRSPEGALMNGWLAIHPHLK